jgi:hypothetical protein
VVTSFALIGSNASTNYGSGYVALLRGSTTLKQELAGEYYPSGTLGNQANYIPYSVQYVDSPATTSATTYKMQINNIFSVNSWSTNPTATSIQISALEILV